MTRPMKTELCGFCGRDLAATKAFFHRRLWLAVCRLRPQLLRLRGEGLDGGFYRAELCSQSAPGRRSWCSTAPISRRPRQGEPAWRHHSAPPV